MSDAKQSAAEVEQEIAEERSRISATTQALRSKLSVGTLIDEVVGAAGRFGGAMGRKLGRTVRDNPIPATLLGVGLIWLIASGSREKAGRPRFGPAPADSPHQDAGATDAVSTATAGATAASNSGVSGQNDGDGSSMKDEAFAAGKAAASSLAESAGRARAAAAQGAEQVKSSLSEGADQAKAALREGAEAVGEQARHARDRAAELGEEAQNRGARAASRARGSVERLIEEQPLVVAGLALALGAAIGGAVPNSRTENRLMGRKAQQFREDIRGTAKAEGEKLRSVAKAAGDEAREIAKEATEEATEEVNRRTPEGKDLADRAEAKVTSAAKRVEKAAEDEAERVKLGQGKAKPTIKSSKRSSTKA